MDTPTCRKAESLEEREGIADASLCSRLRPAATAADLACQARILLKTHKVHLVRFIASISETIFETATFGSHALKNPEVLTNKLLNQPGINYGDANAKPASWTATAILVTIAWANP
jgi:hypothetical protein